MTAMNKTTAFRGVQECMIASLLTDNSGGLTYGPLIDVEIKGLTFSPNVEEYSLKHNDVEQETDQQLQSIEVSGSIGKANLAVLEVFTGSTTTASGTAPNRKLEFDIKANDEPKYFKLIMRSTRAMGGEAKDVHITFWKCKVSSGTEWSIEDDFANISFTAKAIATKNNQKLKTVTLNETATAIA